MPLARHDGPGLPPGPSRVPCEDVDDATLGVGLGVSDEQHVASGCERRSEAVAVRGVRSRDLLRRAPDAPGVGPEAVDDPRSIGITRLADVHLVSTDRERRAERALRGEHGRNDHEHDGEQGAFAMQHGTTLRRVRDGRYGPKPTALQGSG